MRGGKPLERVNRTWSPELAYAIGLITTDGNLSPDGRHIILVSKDEKQLQNFMLCLGIKVKIGFKKDGFSKKLYKVVQFSDVVFFNFLKGLGLSPNKSKTIGSVEIPRKYFFDFLRGAFDGDGTFYSYFDSRWKNSFMFYMNFISASIKHIQWLRNCLLNYLEVKGHINNVHGVYALKYAKREALKLIQSMYYKEDVICLSRKRLKILEALKIENFKNARVVELGRHSVLRGLRVSSGNSVFLLIFFIF